MAIEVKIPAVGESITSGVVSVWHKKSGEFVNEGEPLFTLETDKVSTEIVAEKGGLLETRVPEGQEVKIGEVVATIDDSKQPGEKRVPEPKKAEKPEKKKDEISEVKTKGPEPEKKVVGQKDKHLSPAVLRIVEEEQLEPEKIHGTGAGGRLTKADVLRAVQERKSVGEADSFPRTAASSPTEIQPSADGRFVRKKMSPLRRKIAQQLVMAQHTAAILTTFNECDMSAVQELRRKTSSRKRTASNSV
jgi:2-oxoglutarate dehydrogenase E2 component (dihydrolipoamide succinyltransferase)